MFGCEPVVYIQLHRNISFIPIVNIQQIVFERRDKEVVLQQSSRYIQVWGFSYEEKSIKNIYYLVPNVPTVFVTFQRRGILMKSFTVSTVDHHEQSLVPSWVIEPITFFFRGGWIPMSYQNGLTYSCIAAVLENNPHFNVWFSDCELIGGMNDYSYEVQSLTNKVTFFLIG